MTFRYIDREETLSAVLETTMSMQSAHAVHCAIALLCEFIEDSADHMHCDMRDFTLACRAGIVHW